MARTVQQIRDYTRAYLDVDDTDIPDELVDSWIGEGQTLILRMRPVWPHLYTTSTITTAADTADYTTTIEKIEDIQGPDLLLRAIEPIWGDKVFTPDVTDSSPPYYWAEIAETTAGVNTVRLYPTPSSVLAYTVRGFRYPVTPTAAGDTPDLPQDFHFPLQSYVVIRACHQQNDFEQGQILTEQFQQVIGSLLDHFNADVVRPVIMNRQKTWGRENGLTGALRFPFEPHN